MHRSIASAVARRPGLAVTHRAIGGVASAVARRADPQLVRRAAPRLAAAAHTPLRRRCTDAESKLASSEVVTAWMDDPALVDSSLWPHRRVELWMHLRMLKGLDLPDFLEGTKMAYVVIQQLMYERNWDELAPLVSDNCLNAMQETMEAMASAAQRVQFEEGSIQVQSSVLRSASVLEPGDDVPVGTCHLDVVVTADESFQIFNYHTNEPMPPFDGQTRSQTSTWRFEGVVTPNWEVAEAAAEQPDWKLHAIV